MFFYSGFHDLFDICLGGGQQIRALPWQVRAQAPAACLPDCLPACLPAAASPQFQWSNASHAD